jgi:hypothetical protein
MTIETVSVTPGSGKDIAVDTIASKEFQVVKVSLGAEDAHDMLVDSGQQTMANSVPVAIASDQSVIPAGGNVAHDAADAGNPVKVGAKAVAHGASPTAVAAGDRTDLYANRHGILFVIGGHPNVVSYGMSITTAVTNAVIGPTVSAGQKFVCTAVSFVLDNASTVFPSVAIGFGTANTPAYAGTPGTLKVLAGHPGCPAGGGRQKGDGSGIVGVGGDDEEVRITTVGNATGNGLYVEVSGYIVES